MMATTTIMDDHGDNNNAKVNFNMDVYCHFFFRFSVKNNDRTLIKIGHS